MKQQEQWRPVAGFEGRFEVSDKGRFKSLAHSTTFKGRWGNQTTNYAETILQPSVLRNNRILISTCFDGRRTIFQLAREVAKAFLGPPPTRHHQVNHIDGDPLNNDVQNLEWVTASENQLHAKHVLGKGIGEKHHAAKLTAEQVREIFLDPRSSLAVAADYGVTNSNVRSIRQRHTWRAETAGLAAPQRSKRNRQLNAPLIASGLH